jgi:serine/threonine protein kinase
MKEKIVMNHYVLDRPFSNQDAGFSRWTTAKKSGKEYFLKEFLDPVYPISTSLSEALIERRKKECEAYEQKRIRYYKRINEKSDGNLVRIDEFFRYDSHYYIATKRVRPSGIGPKELRTFHLNDRLFLCLSLAHTASLMHEGQIVHADIKESNIIITRTAGGKLIGKIIDFDNGFLEEEPPEYEDELGGDQVYFSPEGCLFVNEQEAKLTCKMDVFAFGLLFHQYLTGDLPGFNKEEYSYPHESVLDGQPLIISDILPEELRKMMEDMLKADPDQRCSMDHVYEVLKDMYFGEDKKEVKQNWFMMAGDL